MNAQEIVDRETRRYHVAETIFCPVTGTALDVKTAIMVESRTTNKVLAVMSPQGWELRKGEFLKMTAAFRITNTPGQPGEIPAPAALDA